MEYTKFLLKINKEKYIGCIAVFFVLAIGSVIGINSFLKEITSGEKYIIYVVLIMANILAYVVFRLIYKEEVFLFEDNKINMMITNEKAKKNVIKNKILQLIFFLIYLLVFSCVGAIIFRLSLDGISILMINYIITITIFFGLGITEMVVLNKYRKHYFEGIFPIAFIAGIAGFIYVGNLIFLFISVVAFILNGILNLRIIMRGKK